MPNSNEEANKVALQVMMAAANGNWKEVDRLLATLPPDSRGARKTDLRNTMYQVDMTDAGFNNDCPVVTAHVDEFLRKHFKDGEPSTSQEDREAFVQGFKARHVGCPHCEKELSE